MYLNHDEEVFLAPESIVRDAEFLASLRDELDDDLLGDLDFASSDRPASGPDGWFR